MSVYYNDNEPYAAQWLRNLIDAGHLPRGVVDERSIEDIQPGECGATSHFFAGIGGWPYALRLAGWPEDWPVWTGSCPCQPFSAAGKSGGVGDKRHLWPAFRRLISECRPATIFGEQVASKAGRQWLAGVRVDLERMGYAVGCSDLPAASVGAPHIRQRLFWVAHTASRGLRIDGRVSRSCGHANEFRSSGRLDNTEGNRNNRCAKQAGRKIANECGEVGGMADSSVSSAARQQQHGEASASEHEKDGASRGCGMGNTDYARLEGRTIDAGEYRGELPVRTAGADFWRDFDLVHCSDGKSRRIEPGTSPLAHEIPARVGKLRAYGNAIVAPEAAEFIMAYMETLT